MHRPHPTRLSRRTRRLLLITTLASSTAMVGAGAYTIALFTDSAPNAGNAFVVGTVSIGVSPSSALIALTGMLPGDSTTGTLTVSSTGNSTLRYAISTAATNPDGKALRDQMALVIKTKDTNTAGCGNFNGTQLFNGTLANGAVGDPAQGGQAGDRSLAGGASEILCFRATLPGSTGNAFAGAATNATFTFSAEQTANNP